MAEPRCRPSRVDKMRKYLEDHAAEIEAATSGSVYFDYGDDVTAKVTRVDRLRDQLPAAVHPVMD